MENEPSYSRSGHKLNIKYQLNYSRFLKGTMYLIFLDRGINFLPDSYDSRRTKKECCRNSFAVVNEIFYFGIT